MSKVRVCFLGTPEFAVTSLKRLIADDHYQIVGVVTQPDRPAGRKLQLTPSPVKNLAEAHGLRVISPEKINQEMILQEIESWGAEVAVVVAFGQILSPKFLSLFPFGAVNVHGSILPRWRGAAPIQRALQAGDHESGVTLQRVVKELDAGDIIGLRRVALNSEITAPELHDQLAELGADLLHVELMDYVRGNLAPEPQALEGLTYAKKIDKAECQIDWRQPARGIHNQVRGFLMGPGSYSQSKGKKYKFHRTTVVNETQQGSAGTIVRATMNELQIQTGKGILAVLEIQPESRAKLKIQEFLKSSPFQEGDCFDVGNPAQ